MMSLSSLPVTPENEPEFVNKSETQKYQCILHHGILREAIQTSCGHRFCKSCIEQWLTTHENTKCPANEEDCVILSSTGENGTNINQDYSARREILNFKVCCSFKEFGCKKTLPWKKLQSHEAVCEFKQSECPNKCGMFLTETQLRKHVESECELRTVTCQYCQASLTFKQLEDHQTSECPEVEVPCTYNCHIKSIKRGQLQHHLEVCPNKPKSCKFKSAGCLFTTNSDKDLKRHESEDFNQHLEYLSTFVLRLESEKKDLQKDIEDLKRRYSSDTGTVPRGLETVPRGLEDKDREVQKLRKTIKDQGMQLVAMSERMITLERKSALMPSAEVVAKFNQEMTAVKGNIQTLEHRLETANTTRPRFAVGSGG